MNGTEVGMLASAASTAVVVGAKTFIQWYALHRARQEDVPTIVQTIYQGKRPDTDTPTRAARDTTSDGP